jgi:DNA topoisomerase IB
MARTGGWRRRGRKGAFWYADARGKRIEDPAKIARIEALVIPPAWRDVWISPRATAKLQAVGVDAAGRRQYLYHPEYRARQEQAKYDRLILFAERLPSLREAMAEHMEHDGTDRERVSAVALRLINLGWLRVGGDRYARESRTYGVTTLQKRHVSVRGHRVKLSFRAKHGVQVRTTIVDGELAAAVKDLLALPGGSRLFRYEWEGDVYNLTGKRLNDYVHIYLGDDFSAKDFRTWGGTLTAAVALAEHGPLAAEEDERRVLAAVMRRVGTELANTPAVARESYVNPLVVEHWRRGRTLEHFRPRSERIVSGRDTGLVPEEAALLRLLRS